MRGIAQRGASGLLVLVILVLIVVAMIASYALSRMGSGGDDRAVTSLRLEAAASSLEQYASVASRLPCPANGNLPDTDANAGLENRASPTALTCASPDGTLPWKTLGLNRESTLDAWGRRISYRVYTGGGVGSLTQNGGASMVECDVTPAAPPTPVDATGLCASNADPYLRNTLPADFLAGKGLTVWAFNPDGAATKPGHAGKYDKYVDAAYVLMSHGATGLGAFTISGAMLPAPATGDEHDNTLAAGEFTARPESHPEVAASDPAHYDDQLVYRRLAEFVKRANLVARDWPETTSAVFDAATLATALGVGSVSPGSTGQTVINFPGVSVSGFSGAGSAATNIAFDTSGGVDGIGVRGGGGGTTNYINSQGSEFLQIKIVGSTVAKAGITLNHFGTFTVGANLFAEQVEFRFFDGTTQVDSITKAGCNPDGGLASFDLAPSGPFDSIEVRPQPAISGTTATLRRTSLLVSAFNACPAAATSCATSLSTPSNVCA